MGHGYCRLPAAVATAELLDQYGSYPPAMAAGELFR
jgi:hypothetical protein